MVEYSATLQVAADIEHRVLVTFGGGKYALHLSVFYPYAAAHAAVANGSVRIDWWRAFSPVMLPREIVQVHVLIVDRTYKYTIFKYRFNTYKINYNSLFNKKWHYHLLWKTYQINHGIKYLFFIYTVIQVLHIKKSHCCDRNSCWW